MTFNLLLTFLQIVIPGRILGAEWRATFQKYYLNRGRQLKACSYVYLFRRPFQI